MEPIGSASVSRCKAKQSSHGAAAAGMKVLRLLLLLDAAISVARYLENKGLKNNQIQHQSEFLKGTAWPIP